MRFLKGVRLPIPLLRFSVVVVLNVSMFAESSFRYSFERVRKCFIAKNPR